MKVAACGFAAGDMAELGADAVQSEERPGALERVLRLGQPALLERTGESVVLRPA